MTTIKIRIRDEENDLMIDREIFSQFDNLQELEERRDKLLNRVIEDVKQLRKEKAGNGNKVKQ